MNKKIEVAILCALVLGLTGCSEQGDSDHSSVLLGEKMESISDGDSSMTSSKFAESENVGSDSSGSTTNTDFLEEYVVKWDGLTTEGMDEEVFLADIDLDVLKEVAGKLQGAVDEETQDDHTPINWGTPDGPEIAARNYYKNTVFEVVSLDVRKVSQTYVLFEVAAKKGGVTVDPNRTIELKYEEGAWKVTNEGY